MGELSTRIYKLLGVSTPFDPQHRFVTSYLLSPLLLFLWRALVAIYVLTTLIITFARNGTSQFSFFTVLSYWGLFGWYTISAVHTFSFWISLRKWRKANSTRTTEMREKLRSSTPSNLESQDRDQILHQSEQEKPRSWLERFYRPFQLAHVLLWSTVATFPLIVTIVFWALLAGNAFDSVWSTWDNISVHALNLVFAVLEVFVLGRGPMLPWWHCLSVFLLIAMYLGVAYITYAAQGFYTYDFLDTQENGGLVGAYIAGIGVGCVISFMIGQFLIFLREFIAAKIQFSGGWGSAKALGVPDEALVATQRGPGPEGEGGRRIGEDQSSLLRQRWPAGAL